MNEKVIIFVIVALCAAWLAWRFAHALMGKNTCEFCDMEKCKKTKCKKDE